MFNVRIYGLLINDKNEVLVSDELVHNKQVTKFPGGGLDFGEGTLDAIKREFIEELNLKVEVLSHFYTTDFFVQSAYKSNEQVLSIYYLVKNIEPIVGVDSSVIVYQFSEAEREHYQVTGIAEKFRFMPITEINEGTFALPIDRHVGLMLRHTNIDGKMK